MFLYYICNYYLLNFMKRDINFVCDAFDKVQDILGSETIADEVKHFMHVDDLADFVEHICSMYDLENIIE